MTFKASQDSHAKSKATDMGAAPDCTLPSYIYLEVVIYILFAFEPITSNVILVLLAPLSLEFAINPTAVLIAIPAFRFPFAVVQLFSGALSDIKGRLSMIFSGLIVIILGMLIAVFSTSLFMYAIANALGGFGFGLIMPVIIALVSDLNPMSEIAKKMGYLGTIATIGVGLGPLVAGQMVRFGWRSIYILFFVLACCCLIAVIILRKFCRTKGAGGGPRVLMMELSEEWKRPVIIILIITTFLLALSYIGVQIWTARALAGIIAEDTLGIVISLAGFAGAVAGILLGLLMKRLGIEITLLIGLVTLTSGILIFVNLGDVTASGQLAYIALALLLEGFGGGLLFPALIYYSQVLSPERRGALAGTVTSFSFIAVALTPFIFGPFFVIGIHIVYLAFLVVTIVLIPFMILLYYLAGRMTR